MHRSRRFKKSEFEMNLDSLMDILTCSVGVMLFVVMIAVMQAKGSSILYISPPLLREPPEDSRRVLALCQKGRVRILDVGVALEQLMEGKKQLKFADVPGFVAKANRKNVSDGNFNYRLVFRDAPHGEDKRRRFVSLRVEARPDVNGEAPEELGHDNSKYEKFLATLDKNHHWLAFGVDKDSVKVFQKARLMAFYRGFHTGWDPVSIEFPYEEVILGGGFRQQMEGKPRSGLTIIQ